MTEILAAGVRTVPSRGHKPGSALDLVFVQDYHLGKKRSERYWSVSSVS